MDEQLQPEDIDYVLAIAEAELERWSAPRVSTAHVLSVLATVHPDEFAQQFGPGGHAALADSLTRTEAGGSLRDIRALLAAADDVGDAMRRLHALERWRPLLVDQGVAPAHEAWLLEHIDERFDLYAIAPASDTLDELYVLIGALKVVNFERAYTTMRARLSGALNTSEHGTSSGRHG